MDWRHFQIWSGYLGHFDKCNDLFHTDSSYDEKFLQPELDSTGHHWYCLPIFRSFEDVLFKVNQIQKIYKYWCSPSAKFHFVRSFIRNKNHTKWGLPVVWFDQGYRKRVEARFLRKNSFLPFLNFFTKQIKKSHKISNDGAQNCHQNYY